MNLLFYAVYRLLMMISSWTGLSYEDVNIIVYYIIIPLVFFALIDKLLRRHICVICFGTAIVVSYFLIKDFDGFCERLFERSVSFLEGFSQIGLGYYMASVVVCVLVPLILFGILFYFAYPAVVARHFPTLRKIIPTRGKQRWDRD